MGTSLDDAPGAGVGGDDGTEMGRQPEGCLPILGGAVPAEVMGEDQAGEVGEEGVRVCEGMPRSGRRGSRGNPSNPCNTQNEPGQPFVQDLCDSLPLDYPRPSS